MKRVVICGNMNVGEIEGLIQNVYLVFKYYAIVFFGEKQIGSIFFFLHLIADVVVDILAVYLARIAGSFDLVFDCFVNSSIVVTPLLVLVNLFILIVLNLNVL